jgi:hypothetical protein
MDIYEITNRSRGFGFVKMPGTAGPQKAGIVLKGAAFDHRYIAVAEAGLNEKKPVRSFSGLNPGSDNTIKQ